MTELTDQNVVVGPQVRVAIYGEEDWVFAYSELDEYNEHDPASISDEAVIQLVANYRDITTEELQQAVLGDNRGELVVSRPSTGNITIRPETKLG
jgi:hypothetical protein